MPETCLVEMRNISKRFSGVQALSNVELSVRPGEVHALIGENGAGKSTLMKILGGAYVADCGSISICGEDVKISNPIESAECGIAVIYQEQSLVNSLTIADNILLGRIPKRIGWINKKLLHREAKKALDLVGADFDLNREVGSLTVAQKQFVEIAKALSMNAKIIVMDEPSAVLTLSETRKMFEIISQLKAQGRSIIYISHRMEEIFEITDRCTVLKDGQYVGCVETKNVSQKDLIKMMTGREISDIYPVNRSCEGEIIFRAEGLTRNKVFQDVSFTVRSGEILGFSGLVGSGRTEVARAIVGIDPLDKGRLFLNDIEVSNKHPYEAIRSGIMYVSEDRKESGMVLKLSIEDNITLSTIGRYSKLGYIIKKKERKAIQSVIEKLNVKATSLQQIAGDLSGGNQQKVMLANGILVNAQVMIIDEPTRGVDVGTKTEIYKIIREMANMGKAIIMISSELPEIIGMSDRVIVMHRGRVAGEINAIEATEHNLLTYATGGV
jgi:ribose transport system ATP-binding protein